MSDTGIKNWGRYCQIIFVRAQEENGVKDPTWPKAGDQLELRGNTYQFKFYRGKDGRYSVYAPRASAPLADGKKLVTAVERAKVTVADDIDF